MKANHDRAVIQRSSRITFARGAYLGEMGYESQMTDELVDPPRPNNLYEPVAGDHGAHGIFDNRSYSFSPQPWANINRGTIAVVVADLAGLMYLAWWRRRRGELSR